MSRYRIIRKVKDNSIVLGRARWCASSWCHFKGLQFVRKLDDDEGLLFVYGNQSVVGTTIHMLFMFMSIGVVWLDENRVVVDKKLAKPWRLAYAPAQAAQYFIEAPPAILERVEIGDVLKFDEDSA